MELHGTPYGPWPTEACLESDQNKTRLGSWNWPTQAADISELDFETWPTQAEAISELDFETWPFREKIPKMASDLGGVHYSTTPMGTVFGESSRMAKSGRISMFLPMDIHGHP